MESAPDIATVMQTAMRQFAVPVLRRKYGDRWDIARAGERWTAYRRDGQRQWFIVLPTPEQLGKRLAVADTSAWWDGDR